MKKTDAPDIFDYLDFRSFLRDMYAFKKEQYRQFSYRSFALKAGFSSPNFLKLVMDGQRNLTNESVAKIAQGFGLKKSERDYLENLVFMNQAQRHDERDHYYQKTLALKKKRATNIFPSGTIPSSGKSFCSEMAIFPPNRSRRCLIRRLPSPKRKKP